jgi:hypothetical protein
MVIVEPGDDLRGRTVSVVESRKHVDAGLGLQLPQRGPEGERQGFIVLHRRKLRGGDAFNPKSGAADGRQQRVDFSSSWSRSARKCPAASCR